MDFTEELKDPDDNIAQGTSDHIAGKVSTSSAADRTEGATSSAADHTEGATSSAAYLERLHKESSSEVHMDFEDPIDEVAYYYFGFRMPSTSTIEQQLIVFKDRVWVKVLAMLGSARLPRPPVRKNRSQPLMCSFFFDLLEAKSLEDAPHIYDLVSQDTSARPNVTASLGVEIISCPNDENFFIIQPLQETDVPFVIGLKRAGTVLEIIRRGWGATSHDIVKALVENGFAFNTLIVGPPAQQYSPSYRQKFAVLGDCPSTFAPGLTLLAGGVIAHLARDVIGVDTSSMALLKMPGKGFTATNLSAYGMEVITSHYGMTSLRRKRQN
ncbi:hypothetical protein BT96DRAFT_1006240 [Gymnopus androsaceus JB14]|uniref:Uncharacterized protein n=1 Tax=Gymnopus androsaceus JB14 TaxID=1447944 RepID=A0A6A4GKV9_9AGAR|nr:hypothetical protein BT96DRAFT_1006240 [Gymnopus androsaceus JB14]